MLLISTFLVFLSTVLVFLRIPSLSPLIPDLSTLPILLHLYYFFYLYFHFPFLATPSSPHVALLFEIKGKIRRGSVGQDAGAGEDGERVQAFGAGSLIVWMEQQFIGRRVVCPRCAGAALLGSTVFRKQL